MTTFYVKDVFEALAKNGFEHLRGQWFADDFDGVVKGACILGQGAINLGVFANDNEDEGVTDTLVYALNNFTVPTDSKWYLDSWSRVGDTIISWNDRTDHTQHIYPIPVHDDDSILRHRHLICTKGEDYDREHVNERGVVPDSYVLKTYEEVVNMAYDLLRPYFEEKITLEKKYYHTGIVIE